jgi:hypothetical protein
MASIVKLDTIRNLANVPAFTVSAGGAVNMPARPMFSAYGTGGQAFSGAAAWQILQLSRQNTIGARATSFNTSTYTITAPVSGTYMFLGKVTQQGTTATGPISSIFINGVQYVQESVIPYYTAYMASTGFNTAQLAQGDAVTYRVVNNNSTTFNIDLDRSAFAGFLIG